MDGMGEEDIYGNDVIVSYAHAWHMVLRVAGSMMDRHTILIGESRYDRVFNTSRLELSTTVIVLAEQHPPGRLKDLHERVKQLRDSCPKPPEFTLDTTRSPYLGTDFPFSPDLVQLSTMANDKYLGNCRFLGRLLLLSALHTRIRDRRLSFRLPLNPIPPMVGNADFDRALTTVQAKLPAVEAEEAMLSETGPDDDLALCVGMVSMFANEHMPDPVYRPNYKPPFVKEVKLQADTSWVV